MKFYNKELYFVVIIYLSLHALRVSGLASCPPPNIDISPCDCVDERTGVKASAIRCFGEQMLNLMNIFDILNANIAPENRDFNIFYSNNTGIEDIPEYVFKGFTFEEIYFENNRKLWKIDSKAFKGLEESVKQIHICDTKLNVNSDNYSDLKVFDGLKNLDLLDLSSSECPPQSLLGPKCKCELMDEYDRRDVLRHKSTLISCQQILKSEELIQVFNQLNENLKLNKINFFRFHLKESKINKLPENLFNRITFTEISIEDCPQLNSIHKNIFQSIEPFVNKLSIDSIGLSNDSQTIRDVWYAMSSLSNLVRLELSNVFNEIPTKAFKLVGTQTQWRLKYFSHSGYQTMDSFGARIVSIGSYAFDNLPNIQVINLQNNLIEKIDKYAFANQIPSDKKLLIRLSRNKLNPNSFAIGSFAGSRRPIRLEFGQAFMGCNRDITYLDESVFSAFLDKEGNELDMGCSFAMHCDCRMKWLYEAPDYWKYKVKSGSFGDIVIPCELEVEDGVEEVSIWDLPEDYFECKTDVIYRKDRFEAIVNNSVVSDFEDFMEDALGLIA